MKKVLIIAYNDLNNSGVPNVIYQTIRALHDEYAFDILIFKDDEYYYQKLLKEGIKVNLIKYKESKPNGQIAKLFWWFHKMPKQHYLFMKQLLIENDYSVIHSFKEYYSWPFFKAAKEAGITKRILHRNINPEQPKQISIKLLEKKNRRLSIKYASDLVGVSELCCKNAYKNHKYTVLYNCYDEQKYNMNVKNKLSDNELVLTQVGSYSENKNQLFSLQVLRELLKLNTNTKLNLVGANGMTPYYQKLIDFVKDNNLENNVSFIERSDSVEKIYENTTFVLIPSIREGFSLVAVEAQACGIQVSASSSLPKEVNLGGVKFYDLTKGSNYWSKEIYNSFLIEKNNRMSYNASSFTFAEFQKNLHNLYKI